MELWSGDSAKLDGALQLLYIVDIIALWAEHSYKPFAGACIQSLQAQLENKEPPSLKRTLAHQLEINRSTFPWLYLKQKRSQLPVTSDIKPSIDQLTVPFGALPNKGRPRHSEVEKLLEKIGNLSLDPSRRDYIIPERDSFIWLLDLDPSKGDLLIVRVDVEGKILPPLLIFEYNDWEHPHLRYAITEEEGRAPDDILFDFRIHKDRSSYRQRCVDHKDGYFRGNQLQFCAILPLNPDTYDEHTTKATAGDAAFKKFESALKLPQLIEAVDFANRNWRWCYCDKTNNEHSPRMILCDNLKCPIGWYHKVCEAPDEPDEDISSRRWFCKKCLRKGHRNKHLLVERRDIDEDILLASDDRIQYLKALASVWKYHDWPSGEEMQYLVDRVSSKLNMDVRNKHDTITGEGRKESQKLRSWALWRKNPKVMVPVKQAVRAA